MTAQQPQDDLGTLLVAETPGLLRFARSLVRDPYAAEDLVQEALVRAVERADRMDEVRDLGAWLRRVVHNLAVDRARPLPGDHRRRGRGAVDVRRLHRRHRGRGGAPRRPGRRSRTPSSALPFIYRTAVVLHDLEGMTVLQVSDVTGVELPAAKQRLRRGRMMLVTASGGGARAQGVALPRRPLRCWDARSLVSDYLDGDVDAGTATSSSSTWRPARRVPPSWPRSWGSGTGSGGCATRTPSSTRTWPSGLPTPRGRGSRP